MGGVTVALVVLLNHFITELNLKFDADVLLQDTRKGGFGVSLTTCCFITFFQGVVKSMGGELLTALVNEIVKKEKTRDHCQTAITHLTKVNIRNL